MSNNITNSGKILISGNIRNVAVIAHVDHGKTTLVDALLKQTHTFRENQEEMTKERIMDNNEQEKERGITILAKNCSINYKGTTINIIDTPGHADFSGEVERTLGMAEGALLIIDAQEGPMPQTRFVLRKALELGLRVIVVINKIDKPFARIPYVLDKTESLFLELAADESQLEFPILYAIGKEGKVYLDVPESLTAPAGVEALLDTIVDKIPAPQTDTEAPFKMLVSSFNHNTHLGKIAVGKIHQGSVKRGDKVILTSNENKIFTVEKIFLSKGLGEEEVESATAGDIAFLAGIYDLHIGETISAVGDTKALPTINVSDPTLHISIGANTSPFAGREGEFTTGRQLGERIEKELEKNLSLKVHKKNDGKYQVSGRGELHLSVFLETMRREGYEMEVEKPQVITKEIDGVRQEPVEELDIIVPLEYQGVINQELGKRYAAPVSVEQINEKEAEFVYHIPTRALMGLRSLLLTLTRGTVLFTSQVIEYKPVGKAMPKMRNGVLIASESGEALSYGIKAAQERGVTFVDPAQKVYEGMIIGKNSKEEDIAINVCKGKKLTNMRSKSSDGVIQLVPSTALSLEQCLDFLESDELLEITPVTLRLRKKILVETERRKEERKTRQS